MLEHRNTSSLVCHSQLRGPCPTVTGVFLILIDGGETLACLALCAGPVSTPPVYILYKVYSMLQKEAKNPEQVKQGLRQMQ